MKPLLLIVAALLWSTSLWAQDAYMRQRRSLFDRLPIYSSDIVFLGDGAVDDCEWDELFNNRHVKNRGIAGDRASWVVGRIDSILAGHPKRLFVMVGMEDLLAGSRPEEVVRQVGRLIERFQDESRWTRLYVQSILPVNPVEFDNPRLKGFPASRIVITNKQLETLCDERGVAYLDVWGALADREGRLDKRYSEDGLRLSGTGYQVWRDAVKQHVK